MTTDNLTTDRPTASTDWAEAFHSYEREEAAYQVVARKYEAACADYDGKATPPDALARYDAAEAEHDAASDKRWNARNKLLLTCAPDAAAMLAKLELLADIMTEGDDQDAPAVRSIRDDAKRLFGGP